jgi:hypothetical protein
LLVATTLLIFHFMTDRRFNESEVAAIFQRATETQQSELRQLPSAEGMTLGQLQEIGKEVGISPEQIAQAAQSLTRGGQVTTRNFLGLPLRVGRTVELDRPLSEAEWERLVVDLRETFDARGRLKSEGSFRQWTNGNLQALLEPTVTGHRLRLRTMKANAYGWMVGGLAILGITISMAITLAVRGEPLFPDVLLSGILGTGFFAIGALQLPSWARLRQRQMAEVAERLAAAVSPFGTTSPEGARELPAP